jgi:uncharacterized protein YjbI with pentapeptide repeats
VIPGQIQLEADCARCFGLCCVALAFSRSADFAIDKPVGEACPNLDATFRCAIHDELRQRGFPGCSVFDCLGAGQQVSQAIYAGRDWRSNPVLGSQMFEVFARVRELHMLLWHLREALRLPAAQQLHRELSGAFERIHRLTSSSPESILAIDMAEQLASVRDLLRCASARARDGVSGPDYSNKDLIGANLAGAQLRGANLRGAQLIGANLRKADLRLADLTAADLRDTDVRGADLSGALFVRQAQLDAARGDADTRLPAGVQRPKHWSA